MDNLLRVNELNEILTTINEVKRLEELNGIMKDWNNKFRCSYGNNFTCFDLSINRAGQLGKTVCLEELKEDYEHYKYMTEIDYPHKRKLNKLVKEYNFLCKKYEHVSVNYVIEDLKDSLNKTITREQRILSSY